MYNLVLQVLVVLSIFEVLLIFKPTVMKITKKNPNLPNTVIEIDTVENAVAVYRYFKETPTLACYCVEVTISKRGISGTTYGLTGRPVKLFFSNSEWK